MRCSELLLSLTFSWATGAEDGFKRRKRKFRRRAQARGPGAGAFPRAFLRVLDGIGSGLKLFRAYSP